MSLFKKIKQNILGQDEDINDNEQEFQELLDSKFPEAEDVIIQEDKEPFMAANLFAELKQLITNKDFSALADKMNDLEFVVISCDKKIQHYKSIIKRQVHSNKERNKAIVFKSKKKSALLMERDQQIKELNEGLKIYKGLEFRYAKALKEIEAQQKIIEYNRMQSKK